VSEQEVDIVLDWMLPQGVVEALLGAAVTEAWMRGAAAGDRPPKVRICRLDGRGVGWRITYLLDPRRKAKGPARHELLACVQRHLVLAGIRPAADWTERAEAGLAGGRAHPAPEGPLAPVTRKVPDFDTPEARRRVLDTAPLLDSLSAQERDALAARMRLLPMPRGQSVVQRGSAGRSMFVLAAGVAEVLVPDGQGTPQRARVLGPGDSFGEMSLLTGAERSADVQAVTPLVLFEIGADELAPLLLARPALAEALSRAMAAHEQADARLRQSAEAPAAAPSRSAQLAARIRAAFRL
jgi:CRP-like cAMP-binding protein